MLMVVLMLFVVRGTSAQEDCFVFEGSGNTVITGLTAKGMAVSELTIPASVEKVKEGAFAYANSALTDLTIGGGNPEFEDNVLSAVNSSLTTIDAGSGMSADNIHTMLVSLGTRGKLEEVVIEGFRDASTPNFNWSDLSTVLTSEVNVILPAALVSNQVFGIAKVYGRFSISGDLGTFCGNATFRDTDDGSNLLFYVPQEYREETKQVFIERVKYVIAGQGVLIHHAKGTTKEADLEWVSGESITIEEANKYNKNMLLGVTEPTEIGATTGDKTNLILYQGAFHPTSGGTIPANRAYLQIPTDVWTAMGAKQLVFNFDDIEAAIDVVTEDTDKSEAMTNLYDLAGRRVSLPVNALKGVYIRNGQKAFIK